MLIASHIITENMRSETEIAPKGLLDRFVQNLVEKKSSYTIVSKYR